MSLAFHDFKESFLDFSFPVLLNFFQIEEGLSDQFFGGFHWLGSAEGILVVAAEVLSFRLELIGCGFLLLRVSSALVPLSLSLGLVLA